MKKLLSYIVDKVDNAKYRYEVHSFDSGAVMIDIWADDNFYVVQIEESMIGISRISEEDPGFDTIPQKVFQEVDSFNRPLA